MGDLRSDEDLMTEYQLGDELAFEVLYKRYAGRIYGFLKKKTGDEAMARDIFQTTFMKLHAARSKYDRSLPFAPWLFTICYNALNDAWRKQKRTLEDLSGEIPEVAPAPENIDGDSVDLNILPQKQKRAVEMRYYQDASFEEIAARLETSSVNARQLVNRAVKVLRGLYAKK